MRKIWNGWLREFIILYSILYTLMTILNSILYLAQNVYEDPSGNWHEIDRAIIMLIGVAAYEVASKLRIKNVVLRAVITYIPTMALAFVYVWIVSLREPLASSAYGDVAMSFTGLFLIVFAVAMIREKLKRKEK